MSASAPPGVEVAALEAFLGERFPVCSAAPFMWNCCPEDGPT